MSLTSNDPFPVLSEGARRFQRIVCVDCGATDSNSCVNGRAGEQTLTAFFRRRGWEVDLKKGSHCPSCVSGRTAQRRLEAQKRMEKNVVPMTAPPSENSALAKKIMSDLLFEHYDLARRDYKDGWSDDRVAKDSGVSPAFVAKRRAEDFGPASPPKPPILIDVGRRADMILATVKDVSSRTTALLSRAEEAVKELENLSAAVAAEMKKKNVA